MDKSKIFIASSSRTLTLAEKLSDHIEDMEDCDVMLWNEESRKHTSATIIEMLENEAKNHDFAVIILSRDDVMKNDDGSTKKARDNCVFEAGLFIAALGRKRCFLVNSVKQTDLPSDLGGLISLPFEEPEDLSDREECAKKIKSVASIIKDRIQKLQRRQDQPLSQEQLLEREKLRKSDPPPAELLEDQVVVLSVQPLELEYDAALQAHKNIINRGIEYQYLLRGDDDGARKVCRLLQTILLSPWLDRATTVDFSERDVKIRERDIQSYVIDNLHTISSREVLKVVFMERKPILQYCIHNASDCNEAVLYLKHDGAYIKWEEGERAHDFWNQERTKIGMKFEPPNAIFFGAGRFDVRADPFAGVLRSAIRKYFPEIHDQVTKLCFDGKLD